MKINTKREKVYLLVKVKTSFGEKLDGNELNSISNLRISELLKVELIKKTSVEYSAPVAISLSERLSKPITKWDFLLMMEQIVIMMRKLQENHLSEEHLILDIDNVFINENTKNLYFIYFPLKDKKSHTTMLEFMEIITNVVKREEEADMEYTSRFSFFLKKLNEFEASEIERHIIQENRKVIEFINRQDVHSKISTFIPPTELDERGGYSDTETILDTELSIENEEDGLTTLLDDDTILQEEEETPYSLLYRIKTGETIKIDKVVFRLGRDRNNADYYIDNRYVARRHAELIRRAEGYFIIDLMSTNHTYLNGTEITPNCEIKLSDGDSIKLSNEEFLSIPYIYLQEYLLFVPHMSPHSVLIKIAEILSLSRRCFTKSIKPNTFSCITALFFKVFKESVS